MKIYNSLTLIWDNSLGTYTTLHEDSTEYAGDVVLCCGATAGQNEVASQQTSAYNTMVSQAQQVFGASSQVYSDLVSTFAPTVAAGPDQQGYSAGELSAMNSQAITQTGQEYKNEKAAVGDSMAAQNGGNVALPGGATEGVDASLAENAGNQTANELNQIQQNNYAVGRQNYNNAVSGLAGATNVFNPATSAGSAATSSGAAAANTQNQIATQNNSWIGAVTGALGSVAGVATGGLIKNLGSGAGGGVSGSNGTGDYDDYATGTAPQ